MSSKLVVILDAVKAVPCDVSLFFRNILTRIEARDYHVGLALLSIGLSLYYYRKFTYWSRRNVKNPTPLPLAGNAYSFLLNSYHDLSHRWSKKYGKVYGLFGARDPYLVVADAEVLKRISIKDFDKFTNRHFIDLPSDVPKRGLVLLKDDDWRALRQILSPTFTSGRMKIMYHIMNRSADKVTKQIERMTSSGQVEIDVRLMAGKISMCSTVGSFYGIDLNLEDANNPNSAQYFSQKSHEAFIPYASHVLIEYLVPHSILRWLDYANWRDNKNRGFHFFTEKAQSIIKHRLKSGERQNDYLQLLLEAKEESEIKAAKEDNASDGKLDRRSKISSARLSEEDIIAQVVIFIVVASETTAGLIANTLYLLSFNRKIQQRLYEELGSIRKFGHEERLQFDYDDINSNQYLDCVISESLRLMPPVLHLDRKAGTDYFLEGYNFIIPKDTWIYLDFYGIMTDPDYWPNPEQFDPERFSPENKENIVPGSYCPFGIGPRHCIGFRFALTEAKLAIAKLISKFEFDVAPGAKFPPEPRKPVFIGNEFKSLRTLVKHRALRQSTD